MGTDAQLRTDGVQQHVDRLETELKKRPEDKVLRDHIKRLRKAWELRQPKQAVA
jgi:hypothetical protein